MHEKCDATASASETAIVVVYTPRGPIMLCIHHFRLHADAFDALDYPAMTLSPALPSDVAAVMAAYDAEGNPLVPANAS
jgi:hypothetical protein